MTRPWESEHPLPKWLRELYEIALAREDLPLTLRSRILAQAVAASELGLLTTLLGLANHDPALDAELAQITEPRLRAAWISSSRHSPDQVACLLLEDGRPQLARFLIQSRKEHVILLAAADIACTTLDPDLALDVLERRSSYNITRADLDDPLIERLIRCTLTLSYPSPRCDRITEFLLSNPRFIPTALASVSTDWSSEIGRWLIAYLRSGALALPASTIERLITSLTPLTTTGDLPVSLIQLIALLDPSLATADPTPLLHQLIADLSAPTDEFADLVEQATTATSQAALTDVWQRATDISDWPLAVAKAIASHPLVTLTQIDFLYESAPDPAAEESVFTSITNLSLAARAMARYDRTAAMLALDPRGPELVPALVTLWHQTPQDTTILDALLNVCDSDASWLSIEDLPVSAIAGVQRIHPRAINLVIDALGESPRAWELFETLAGDDTSFTLGEAIRAAQAAT